jgi:hypothetical protein
MILAGAPDDRNDVVARAMDKEPVKKVDKGSYSEAENVSRRLVSVIIFILEVRQ